ncbi:unnamed protein product [Protopolystoma xenopodis]|uniref:Uncharacterized protein n=1 Tax=Protopolystoma xenopodis TaxID=117903 RepID=A0A448X0C2_9PLAT|nr:unnamed protein product [Protopolystoma xenopodis]
MHCSETVFCHSLANQQEGFASDLVNSLKEVWSQNESEAEVKQEEEKKKAWSLHSSLRFLLSAVSVPADLSE